ncbi:G/U mismatch-specific DNA glycosylase [Pseudomonas fluorescens]|nr:G/U mismatch-specific DNA glycosylase [Pseudomonas fluorescens]
MEKMNSFVIVHAIFPAPIHTDLGNTVCPTDRFLRELSTLNIVSSSVGPQARTFGGAAVWVLPNPSGRNLAFTLEQLVAAYRQLHRAAGLQAYSHLDSRP